MKKALKLRGDYYETDNFADMEWKLFHMIFVAKNISFTARSALFGLCIVCSLSCVRSGSGEGSSSTDHNRKQVNSVLVYAAASLHEVMTEAVSAFEKEYETDVQVNEASSGTLARQVEQGGNPDVFISASEEWSEYLDSLGFLMKGFTRIFAYNDLVLITPLKSGLKEVAIDSSLDIRGLIGDSRLAMGDPDHVPAGRYGRQVLEYYGWYEGLSEKIIPAADVRSALMLVEMNEVPLGIVYRTDALKSDKIRILDTFPERSHKRITYVVALCTVRDVSREFLTFLESDSMDTILSRHGFTR